MNEEDLLHKEFEWRQFYITPLCSDVVHEFKERPVILNTPDQVGKED